MTGFTRILAVIAVAFLVSSCGEKKEIPSTAAAIPSDSLISPEKMVHVLADVHMVEAALLIERNEGRESKEKPGIYYQGIFTKYRISRDRYDENIRYYRQNPAKLLKVYEKVIAELETRQQKFPPGK
jgi:hypothetical protein